MNFVLLFFSFFLLNFNVNACTTFCFRDGDRIVFGRNFDFPVGYGHLLINKRNLHKSGMVRPPEKLLEWTSRYGSVTFNQNGREFPFGGMNERGLVIEQMALNQSQYEDYDERFGLTELQWIQYQLDNSASVEEVIASAKTLRISPQSVAKLHFLVADKSGDVATIEFIGGKMVVHRGESLPVKALANDSYEDSMQYLQNFSGFGGNKEIPVSTAPLDRFVNAAAGLKEFLGGDPIDYAFDILDRVRQNDSTTQWSIVYDLNNSEVYFETQKNRETRTLSLSEIDFDCDSPARFVDIDAVPVDGKLQLRAVSSQENEALINRVWDEVEFLAPLPLEVRKLYVDFPASVTCEDQ
ncbi:MAG: linear amide C-N hydrolase [Salinimicrobium sp.]